MAWLFCLDKELLAVSRVIGEVAQSQNTPAYIVGGIVRDLMLKIKSRDLDIVVEGDAIALATVLEKRLNAQLVVHSQFGTATLRLKNGARVDLVTARKEAYPHPGALPVVEKGGIRDDLFRRDFTINAMALKIDPAEFGQLVDEFSGRKDLRHKRVRVLHDLSFQDDPTRILRAIRFEQRLGFQIEAKTLGLLRQALKGRQEERVKPERYFHEFLKMLVEPQPWKNLKRLKALKADAFLGPAVRLSASELKLLESVCKQVQWYRKTPGRDPIDAALPGLSVLLHHSSDQKCEAFIKKFNLTRAQQVVLRQTRALGALQKQLDRRKMASSEIYRALMPYRVETLLFLRAFSKSPAVRRKLDLFLKDLCQVRISVGGEDLKTLGMESSRAMGEILDELLDQKLDGRLRSRVDELRMAGELASAKKKGHHGQN